MSPVDLQKKKKEKEKKEILGLLIKQILIQSTTDNKSA